MSLNIKGEKCSVCKEYFFEEEDIVYCPVCGAPHHRECYAKIGHCGLESLHNTENEYKREECTKEFQKNETQQNNTNGENFNTKNEVKCEMCGNVYSTEENACPECGLPNITRVGGRYIAFDFLGGVPAEEDLGDGVTADEAKQFILNNTHRFIPKFFNFKRGKRSSWNWLALLSPCAWFCSRKMYKIGVLIGTIQIALSMLTIPFRNAMSYIDTSNVKNYIELGKIITENLPTIGITALMVAFAASFTDILLCIISALLGDRIYYKHVISTVSEIKKGDEERFDAFQRRGGVSFTAALIGIFAVNYLPTIIASLTGIVS